MTLPGVQGKCGVLMGRAAALRRFIPVSYTHLDVYKRQALKWGWLAGAGLLLLAALGIYGLTEREDQAQGTVRPVRTEPPTDAPATPVQEPDAPPDVGLTALLQEAEREADLRAFESAKRVDTVVAYQLYLQRCPRCGFRQEARSAIQNLEAEEKISKLKIDFETVSYTHLDVYKRQHLHREMILILVLWDWYKQRLLVLP